MNNYIFDFDGTIANTLELVREIGNEILEELKLPAVSDKDVEKLRGMTIPQGLKYLKIPTRLLPQIAIKGKQKLSRRIDQLQPIEGMPEVLMSLKGRGKVVGIVSSNSKPNVMKFLDRNDLNDAFTFVDTGANIFGKARRLKATLRKHGLPIKQSLYIGDEVRDVEAAHAIALPVAAVTWGLNNRAVLKEHQPDKLISAPKELLGI